MNTIYSHSIDPDNPRKPDDEQRNRIKAKLLLWEFFNENIEEVLSTYLDDGELALEIIRTVIWQLHPYYEGTELIRETQTVLKSLKIPLPHPFIQIFADNFERILVKKMKGQILRNEKSK